LLRDGLFGDACKYPAIFGHEGAGLVRMAGSGVRDKTIRVGDPVLLSFRGCENCPNCSAGRSASCWNFVDANFTARRYSDGKPAARSLEGKPIGSHFFGHSSFAKLSVVQDDCVVRYPYTDIENLGVYAGVCSSQIKCCSFSIANFLTERLWISNRRRRHPQHLETSAV
jgi:Zn-dependent alcohol dehydrogenase